MADFIERHAETIAGVLSCLDRVVITGTLPDICHAEAATRHLFNPKIRIFDYTQFGEPLRGQIRNHAEKLAADQGLTIEFLRNLFNPDCCSRLILMKSDLNFRNIPYFAVAPTEPWPHHRGDGAVRNRPVR